MSRLIKCAVAIDSATRKEIFEKYSKIPRLLIKLEEIGHCRVVKTPDTKYHIYLWDWEKPDMEKYGGFKKILNHRRHSIIEISEDGNIFRDVKTSDIYGCDEEFEEILGWTADIVLWNDSFKSVFIKDADEE